MTNDGTAYEFPIDAIISLDVRISVGTIIVRAREGVETARVELVPRREGSDVLAGTTVRMKGHALTIRGPKGQGLALDHRHGSTTNADIVDFDIVVPGGTAMKLASYGANVTVTGRAGSVHIATGAGASSAERIDGDLVARYSTGTVDVAQVSGSATMRFNGGYAHLGRVDGDVTVACGSGNLEVDVVAGAVRARTGGGAVSVGRAGGDVDLSTGSGELAIGLNAGQPARLDIVTGHGRLISDLDVQDARPASTRPAITIRARTGRGDIRLFRAA